VSSFGSCKFSYAKFDTQKQLRNFEKSLKFWYNIYRKLRKNKKISLLSRKNSIKVRKTGRARIFFLENAYENLKKCENYAIIFIEGKEKIKNLLTSLS